MPVNGVQRSPPLISGEVAVYQFVLYEHEPSLQFVKSVKPLLRAA